MTEDGGLVSTTDSYISVFLLIVSFLIVSLNTPFIICLIFALVYCNSIYYQDSQTKR